MPSSYIVADSSDGSPIDTCLGWLSAEAFSITLRFSTSLVLGTESFFISFYAMAGARLAMMAAVIISFRPLSISFVRFVFLWYYFIALLLKRTLAPKSVTTRSRSSVGLSAFSPLRLPVSTSEHSVPMSSTRFFVSALTP